MFCYAVMIKDFHGLESVTFTSSSYKNGYLAPSETDEGIANRHDADHINMSCADRYDTNAIY